ncbi:major facilitator superfamily domain-containing protein [Halteromyces radiatus]|uniref:major facilitator superfamily domain-containing protein n=1 Tax=Halteromyces radiatus TaxID=101107 RepID=UPI002220E7C2|nr:major facilitator superfamily domain-containing protein [Halteromyces radiatus]KAI8093062.1 major facilitator superfamily domain-containing protein [Halteromyces radiatus]
MITILVTVASFFSPFSISSYFPAMILIEKDLHISSQQMYFTITVYMIFQAIAPSFWSHWADSHGRRPVYLITLLLYILSNIGLAKADSYAMLLCFRILQAFGASSVIGIGAGTIADITTPEERGSYQGWYSLGFTLGPAIGPAMGGLISRYLGWRCIFWSLSISCMLHWLLLVFFLPETLRTRVGDGSGYANPTPVQWWRYRRQKQERYQQEVKVELDMDKKKDTVTGTCTLFFDRMDDSDTFSRPLWKRCLDIFFEPLSYIKYNDVLMLVFFYALQYAANYTVITMIPPILSDNGYNLDTWTIGLTYLANGCGCLIGSILQGYILNYDYYRYNKTNTSSLPISPNSLPETVTETSYPFLERARLHWVWPNALIFNVVLVVYGWCVDVRTPLPFLLTAQVIMGFTSQSVFNSIQTLLIDLFPQRTASINACNNIFRCFIGASATLMIDPTTRILGYGWTYTMVSGILFGSRLFLLVEMKYGPRWRQDRNHQALISNDEMKKQFQ